MQHWFKQATFECSQCGMDFGKELEEDEKKVELLKRLKKVEGKNKEQLERLKINEIIN